MTPPPHDASGTTRTTRSATWGRRRTTRRATATRPSWRTRRTSAASCCSSTGECCCCAWGRVMPPVPVDDAVATQRAAGVTNELHVCSQACRRERPLPPHGAARQRADRAPEAARGRGRRDNACRVRTTSLVTTICQDRLILLNDVSPSRRPPHRAHALPR